MYYLRSLILVLRLLLLPALVLCAANPVHCDAATSISWPLKVSANLRYLVDSRDVPFPIMGDSPWEIWAVSTNDMALYLDDRAARGVTAILMQLESEHFVTGAPRNVYGEVPFSVSGDFSSANDRYFRSIDALFTYARARGIAVFAVPLYMGYTDQQGWADKVRSASLANVRAYGEFLGRRYKDYLNVVWVLGGDRELSTVEIDRVEALGAGIRTFATNSLFTGHTLFKEPATVFPSSPWLKINNVYTYSTELWAEMRSAYLRTPTRPSFLIEAGYENETLGQLPVLTQGYVAMLTGGCGQFYGHRTVWQMNSTWKTDLDSVGARQQSHLAALFRSRRWWLFEPDFNNRIVISDKRSGANYVAASCATNGESLFVWMAGGASRSATVEMAYIAGAQAKGYWFNPRDGSSISLGTFSTAGSRTFTSPVDQPWVLVLDSAAANLPAPGSGNVVDNVVTPPVLELTPSAVGRVRLRLLGTAGASYAVEWTTEAREPREWKLLFAGVASGGSMEWIDAVDYAKGARFYRARPVN